MNSRAALSHNIKQESDIECIGEVSSEELKRQNEILDQQLKTAQLQHDIAAKKKQIHELNLKTRNLIKENKRDEQQPEPIEEQRAQLPRHQEDTFKRYRNQRDLHLAQEQRQRGADGPVLEAAEPPKVEVQAAEYQNHDLLVDPNALPLTLQHENLDEPFPPAPVDQHGAADHDDRAQQLLDDAPQFLQMLQGAFHQSTVQNALMDWAHGVNWDHEVVMEEAGHQSEEEPQVASSSTGRRKAPTRAASRKTATAPTRGAKSGGRGRRARK